MKKEILEIQKQLEEESIDLYLLFNSDDHISEFIPDYYKYIEKISGFTGSNATMVISKDNASLYTDGRYFLQAENELKRTGITLMKDGEVNVPNIIDYIKSFKPKTIAFNFKTTSADFVVKLMKNFPGLVMLDRPQIIENVVKNPQTIDYILNYSLPDEVSGESALSKLERVKNNILTSDCDYNLVSSLDNIAWLFNFRGNDINYNPVNYAYALIGKNFTNLYIEIAKLDDKLKTYFQSLNVNVFPYEKIYQDVIDYAGKYIIDPTTLNAALYLSIKQKCNQKFNFVSLEKSKKNSTELSLILRSHVADAIALIRFMHYLKSNFGKVYMDELTLEKVLLSLRQECPLFLDSSFETICGFNSNGAIVHYEANSSSNKLVNDSGLLLVDSGAQYQYGTTDVTRTFVLGNITNKMKDDFTLVLKAHIALSSAEFSLQTNGIDLDTICRKVLLDSGKDFNHGTGHGVGFLLNVHEDPYRISPKADKDLYFKEGIVTSIEPGLYIENEYGIRHENLYAVVKASENTLCFTPLTLVPFDKDGINVNLLTNDELNWINKYHELVFEVVSPYLPEEDKEYLKLATLKLEK